MKRLLIGAAVVLMAAGAMAGQQPGHEFGYGKSMVGPDTTGYRAAKGKFFDAAGDTIIAGATEFIHGHWAFFNAGDDMIEVRLFQLDGTTGAVTGDSMVHYAPGGSTFEPNILYDSCHVFINAADTLHFTVSGDRDNTCNQYGGGANTLP